MKTAEIILPKYAHKVRGPASEAVQLAKIQAKAEQRRQNIQIMMELAKNPIVETLGWTVAVDLYYQITPGPIGNVDAAAKSAMFALLWTAGMGVIVAEKLGPVGVAAIAQAAGSGINAIAGLVKGVGGLTVK